MTIQGHAPGPVKSRSVQRNAIRLTGIAAWLIFGAGCSDLPTPAEPLLHARSALTDERIALLAPPEPRGDDFFGTAVALNANSALIGIPGRDSVIGADDNVGSAQLFVYDGEGWQPAEELHPPERLEFAELGNAVALRGSTAGVASSVASLPAENEGEEPLDFCGLAYGFRKLNGSWQAQPLVDPAPRPFRLFGNAIAALDDELIVGAPDFSEPGSVHVYRWSARRGWDWVQALERPLEDQASLDGFGYSLAVSGSTLLVGAPGDLATTSGAVYVFEKNAAASWEWTQTLRQELHPRPLGEAFGYSVSVSGDRALIGSPPSEKQEVPLTAYLFERADGAWSEAFTHQFVVTAAASSADLPPAIGTAIGPDTVWLGAPFEGRGTVHPFVNQRNLWKAESVLVPADLDTVECGSALSAWGRSVAIGCPNDSQHAGSVFIALQADGSPCELDSDCGSGHCADSVCCDSACASPCSSCRASEKDSGADGECGPVSASVELAANECPAEAPSSCGRTGRCDGKGACALHSAATVCAQAQCLAPSRLLPTKLCDGRGACSAPEPVNCAPHSCTDGACAPCDADGDCDSGQFCGSDGCELQRSLAESCSEDRQCQSGACPAGHCVDGPECSADGRERIEVDGTRARCSPYLCVAGSCREDCESSADCADDFACSQAGKCEAIPSAPPGSSSACGFAPARDPFPAAIAFALVAGVLLRRRNWVAT